MKIKLGPVSRRTPVYDFQARFLAKAILRLEDAWSRQFRPTNDLSLGDFERFRDMAEYMEFIEASFVCGFVCTDHRRPFPIEKVHSRPEEVIPGLTFSKLRHYVHTIQREEKWNSQYSTALWESVMCGALPLVARRLESDRSLYESGEVSGEI